VSPKRIGGGVRAQRATASLASPAI
jgi:hypothetical protein